MDWCEAEMETKQRRSVKGLWGGRQKEGAAGRGNKTEEQGLGKELGIAGYLMMRPLKHQSSFQENPLMFSAPLFSRFLEQSVSHSSLFACWQGRLASQRRGCLQDSPATFGLQSTFVGKLKYYHLISSCM